MAFFYIIIIIETDQSLRYTWSVATNQGNKLNSEVRVPPETNRVVKFSTLAACSCGVVCERECNLSNVWLWRAEKVNLNSCLTLTGTFRPWQEPFSTFLIHVSGISNLQKRCQSCWDRHEGKTRRFWHFYELTKHYQLEDQSTWFVVLKSAEFTSSESVKMPDAAVQSVCPYLVLLYRTFFTNTGSPDRCCRAQEARQGFVELLPH